MPTTAFEYAIVRVVPRVDRQEFINAGVVVSCPSLDFLKAEVQLDRERLLALAPDADVAAIEEYLRLVPIICDGGEAAGLIGSMPKRVRFDWLIAPRSTVIQLSPVHSGACEDPRVALDQLMRKMVRG
jgi:hypothetical protein